MDLNLGSVSVNELELGYTGAYTGGTVPVLSTVPATAFPGQSRIVTGTNFGATQGTGGVTIGGVAQTITSWADTSVTFTTVLGTNNYGTGKTLELTADAGGSDTDTIELVADTASGFGYVDMSSPNTTDESSVAFGASPTVVTGDQFEWEDFNNLGNLVIDAEGFVSSVDTQGDFRGRFWDASDSTWGATETFTAELPDTTAPTVTSASVPTAGDNIAVQMDESVQVGVGGTGGWTISLGDASVSSAAVDGVDDTIINLTPSRTLNTADSFTISYTQPGDGFQDQASTPNDLATLSGQGVSNNSTQSPPDTAAPTITSAAVPTAGDNIAVQMNESMQVGAGGATGWTISLGDASVTSAAVDGGDDTIINLTPSRTLTTADTLTIGYTQPTDGFQDQAATPNDLATLIGQAVTNNSIQDTIPPTVSSASVSVAGDNIAVQMSEAMQVGAGGTSGWTISLGDASVSSAAVDGVDDTIVNLTPSRTLTADDSFTIGYTQPTDGFQDQAPTPNDLATLSGQAVINNPAYIFSKGIQYAATKTWEWGKRHPMTSMRVRIFK